MKLQGIVGDYVFERDPRIAEWISAKPSTLGILVVSYLFVVMQAGPKYMKHRKPYQLTWITRVYNLMQVVASVGFAISIFHHFYFVMGNSLICTPPDRRTDPLAGKLMDMTFYYWWLRVIDFLDTVFFLLRKKDKQITFLHVFHHVLVVTASWCSAYYGLANLVVFTLCLNSLVHAIMYSYYFLTTLGPNVQKYLWWKKHLTKVQIIQFLFMLVHLSMPMFVECGYPRGIVYAWLSIVLAILGLFVHFYYRSYKAKSKLV